MRALVLLATIVAAGACARSPARAEPPPAPPPLTLEVFESGLAAHGEWIVSARHGRVWRPAHVAAGWQPYLHGEWVWTDDGWFWLTDEPWGWATYHYGRWAYDPVLAWIWVPGYVWGPSWVAWRVGDGFVGWAPLYPSYVVWWVDAYPIVPAHWIFVPTNVFVGVRVEVVAVSRGRVSALVRVARPAPPPHRPRPGVPRLGGPSRPHVETHVGRPVRPAPVVAAPTPADARRRTESGAIPVYRPAPAPPRPAAAAAPARPAPKPAVAAPEPAGSAPPPDPATGPERAPAAAPAREARPAPATKSKARPKREEEEPGRPAPAPRW